jgi:hypothetical protein
MVCAVLIDVAHVFSTFSCNFFTHTHTLCDKKWTDCNYVFPKLVI